jgi:3-oxoacyl-[acyl-carrier protein] reductase
MNINLTGKNALVCGGSDGIGLAIVHKLASAGASVYALARTEDKLRLLVDDLHNRYSGTFGYIVADMNHPDTLSESIVSACGKIRFNILVNNSGGPAPGPITSAVPEAFEETFRRHLIGNHLLAGYCLPGMKESGYGRIINIISTSVKIPLHGLGVSNTIRGAVASWAKTLANETAGFGITVNNILPGATDTERLRAIIRNKSAKSGHTEEFVRDEMLAEIPARRFAHPEEIASAAVFLASEQASYITGINLPVDGGRTGCL